MLMGQMGLFDISKRYARLDAKADALVKLNPIVPWADFWSRLRILNAAALAPVRGLGYSQNHGRA